MPFPKIPYVVLSVTPGRPDPWNLHIGAWDDPDHITIEGFAASWDAWAFAICNGLPDPVGGLPNKSRLFTNRPPDDIDTLFDGIRPEPLAEAQQVKRKERKVAAKSETAKPIDHKLEDREKPPAQMSFDLPVR